MSDILDKTADESQSEQFTALQYYEYTGEAFLKKVISTSSEVLITTTLIILTSEVITNQVLGFSMLNSDFSTLFQGILIAGLLIITGYARSENPLSEIYGEKYAEFTRMLGDKVHTEKFKIEDKPNIYAILGYLLTQTRKNF